MPAEGDRVKHKKLGFGTITRVGVGSLVRYNAATVQFDSGHKTTCSLTRLQVLPKGFETSESSVNPDNLPVREQPVARRRGNGANIDYALIDRAKAASREKHPEAAQIVGRWYGGRAYCEVWDSDQSATIEFYEE